MVRISAFLLILMASTVLADDYSAPPRRFNVQLGEPLKAPSATPDPERLIMPTEPVKGPSPAVNFNHDERFKRMRHAHLAPDGKSYTPCNDPNCRMPIPGNIEICPRCKWSTCQCAYPGQGQLPDLPPIPSAQGFPSAQALPSFQGPSQHHGYGGPHRSHSSYTQQKVLGGWMQVCKVRLDASIAVPKRNCGCASCNGGNQNASGQRMIAGAGLYLPFGIRPGVTLGH